MYSINTVLIPTCLLLWREKDKIIPLNARLHWAMWSVSSCCCQWPSCAAALWAENLRDNVLDGSWQAFTWDSLIPRALHKTAVCLSFALQLSVERGWICELRHSTCARSSEEVLQLMWISCCERNILKVSLHRVHGFAGLNLLINLSGEPTVIAYFSTKSVANGHKAFLLVPLLPSSLTSREKHCQKGKLSFL